MEPTVGKGTTSQKEVMIHLVSNEKLILFSPLCNFYLSQFSQRNFGPMADTSLKLQEHITSKMAGSDGIAPV